MFVELAFEALEKRNSIGGGTREAGDDLVIEEAAGFARGVLHHVITHGDLAIGDEHNFAVLTHAQNGSAVHLRIFLAIRHPDIISHRERASRGAGCDAIAPEVGQLYRVRLKANLSAMNWMGSG